MSYFITRCPTCNRELHIHRKGFAKYTLKNACEHYTDVGKILFAYGSFGKKFLLKRFKLLVRKTRNSDGYFFSYIKKVTN